MSPLRCAVVGLGYWGPNLVRNIASLSATELLVLCDSRGERLKQIAASYPSARAVTDFEGVVADKKVEAVFIATPVSTHFELARRALEAGKHVFVEKPMTATSDESRQLLAMAGGKKLTLMVNHVFLFTPAVRRMREIIEAGACGDMYYYDSVRINLGLFQHDVNVIWDLAVHDLAIMDYIFDERPVSVSAIAAAHLRGRPENIAYLTCFFRSGLIAHVHVNWLAPVKIRQTVIGGSRKMIIYNDIEPDEKIKVYDRGLDESGIESPMLQLGYRLGDMWAPKLDRTEALTAAISHFAECIQLKCLPDSDGESGLRIVRMLEAATQSMKAGGQPIAL